MADNELTIADIRAAIEILEANKLKCECGFEGPGWRASLVAGCWECPSCGNRYDGMTNKKLPTW